MMNNLVYIFDMDPIVTAIRAMTAILYVKKSIHREKIVNPNRQIGYETNSKRTAALKQ